MATSVAELRAAERWPELWAAVMAQGGYDAVLALAATMTDAEVESDVRARQAQAAELNAHCATRRTRISAQRTVLDHVASQLPHSA